MNPYLLINLGTTNFTYVYSKGIIESAWPECEPASFTPPRRFNVEVVDANPENTGRARKAIILIRLDEELFVPVLVGVKYFKRDDDDHAELVWTPVFYPEEWITQYEGQAAPEGPHILDILENEVLDSFSEWVPEQLPEAPLIIETLFESSISATVKTPYIFKFKPDPEPLTYEIKVAIGRYHQQIFFALDSYEIELNLLTVVTDEVPAQLFKNIDDLQKALIEWWSRIWSKPYKQWIEADKNYLNDFMLKLKTVEVKLRAG